MLALPLLMLLVAARPEPVSPRFVEGAWAIGYAAEVERACPGWRRVLPPELARRGLLDPAAPLSAWGYDSPLHAGFWEGTKAAQDDQSAYPKFCADPARFRKTAPIAKAIEPAR